MTSSPQKPQTFTLEPIRPDHASVLNKLARNQKYSSVLGKGYEENRVLAKALSRSYPEACLIKDANAKFVGIVVMEEAGKKNLEATIITEDKNLFAEVLIHEIKRLRGQNYTGLLFISPDYPEELVRVSLETETKISRQQNLPDGSLSREFRISLAV